MLRPAVTSWPCGHGLNESIDLCHSSRDLRRASLGECGLLNKKNPGLVTDRDSQIDDTVVRSSIRTPAPTSWLKFSDDFTTSTSAEIFEGREIDVATDAPHRAIGQCKLNQS